MEIRDRFEAHKNETNVEVSEKLLLDGEAEFEREKHPDPYKPCTAVGGSKWERNLPPPKWACQMTPEEESWYNDKRLWK